MENNVYTLVNSVIFKESKMGLHRDFDDDQSFTDYEFMESAESAHHKRQVRLMLEQKFERKRLREELKDDLLDDDEFDWSELDR